MKLSKYQIFFTFSLFIIVMNCSACTLNGFPAKKPDIGPIGTSNQKAASLPLAERFFSSPSQMYDMEISSGALFENLMKEDWGKSEQIVMGLQEIMRKNNSLKENEKEKINVTLNQLNNLLLENKKSEAYEKLTNLSKNIIDITKPYSLSPLADLITINASVRNTTYYVETKQWKVAATKAKELESLWKQAKPSLEQPGILGEVTKIHSTIAQLKESIDAENIDTRL